MAFDTPTRSDVRPHLNLPYMRDRRPSAPSPHTTSTEVPHFPTQHSLVLYDQCAPEAAKPQARKISMGGQALYKMTENPRREDHDLHGYFIYGHLYRSQYGYEGGQRQLGKGKQKRPRSQDDPNAYMADVTTPDFTMGTGLHKPLSILNTEMILMCFDAEGVQGDTSEWGFAWIDMAEVCDIAPGQKCENWWPLIKAKHYLRDKYKDHPGSQWTDGIPTGFWKEYGSTITTVPRSRRDLNAAGA